MIKFIRNLETRKIKGKSRRFAEYECTCGNIVEMRIENVKYGKTKTCGLCGIHKLKILPETINGITVLKDLGMNNDKPKKRIALFKCNCGKEFICKVNNIKTGSTKSCGCLINAPSNFSHLLSKHPLYRKWGGMKTRIYNKKEPRYHRYGGRGIKICEEWDNNFKSFYDWAISNGWEKGLTLDRIDNDGNYCPENCQWITMYENTIKDSLKFKPTEYQKESIRSLYLKTKFTVTHIAKMFKTHNTRISDILKEGNIKIEHRRMPK